MTVSIVDNANIWEDFVEKCNLNTFLHSQNWANFNREMGFEVFQYGIFEQEKLVSISLIIFTKAKRGSFLLIPHGPQIDPELMPREKEVLAKWRDFFKDFGRQKKCSFVRVQPVVLKTEQNQQMFFELGFKYAPMHAHTELSTVLDLTKNNEEMLLGMRKTTRQMIKKGDKLIAENTASIEHPEQITDEMWQVYEQTGKRGDFVIYSRDFLEKEWKNFGEQGKMTIVRHEGSILSWGMVLTCGKRAFYHQGANILHKKVPASYMCQWQGIQFAKEKGCVSYDFWGVSPKDQPNHPWANIALFKRGFGGDDVQLLHAQDLVLSFKYWLNWAVEKIRAKRRGFVE